VSDDRAYLETSPTHNKGLSALKSKSIPILDEPTASLDPQMVDVVMHLLRQLKRTHTIIVITHDMNVARACDTRTNFKR
jgi:energy-coupling factor transporter ATP-binding protein EcfA2